MRPVVLARIRDGVDQSTTSGSFCLVPHGCLIGILKLHVRSWLEFPPKTCSSHSLPHFSEQQWSFFHFRESEVLEPSLTSLFLSHSIAASLVGSTSKIHPGYNHFSATSLRPPWPKPSSFVWIIALASKLSPCFPPLWASLVVQTIKNLPGIQETRVQSLDREDSPGEGNGYPLQYSCLENHMERGAWWATVHGVTLSTHTLLLLIIFSLSLMSPVPKALSDPP